MIYASNIETRETILRLDRTDRSLAHALATLISDQYTRDTKVHDRIIKVRMAKRHAVNAGAGSGMRKIDEIPASVMLMGGYKCGRELLEDSEERLPGKLRALANGFDEKGIGEINIQGDELGWLKGVIGSVNGTSIAVSAKEKINELGEAMGGVQAEGNENVFQFPSARRAVMTGIPVQTGERRLSAVAVEHPQVVA